MATAKTLNDVGELIVGVASLLVHYRPLLEGGTTHGTHELLVFVHETNDAVQLVRASIGHDHGKVDGHQRNGALADGLLADANRFGGDHRLHAVHEVEGLFRNVLEFEVLTHFAIELGATDAASVLHHVFAEEGSKVTSGRPRRQWSRRKQQQTEVKEHLRRHASKELQWQSDHTRVVFQLLPAFHETSMKFFERLGVWCLQRKREPKVRDSSAKAVGRTDATNEMTEANGDVGRHQRETRLHDFGNETRKIFGGISKPFDESNDAIQESDAAKMVHLVESFMELGENDMNDGKQVLVGKNVVDILQTLQVQFGTDFLLQIRQKAFGKDILDQQSRMSDQILMDAFQVVQQHALLHANELFADLAVRVDEVDATKIEEFGGKLWRTNAFERQLQKKVDHVKDVELVKAIHEQNETGVKMFFLFEDDISNGQCDLFKGEEQEGAIRIVH